KFRVIGTFQFDILVKTGPEILPRMTRNLAVLKHVAQAIPATDHWYPVFERYVGQLGDRIRALGFDPETIAASPTGGRPPRGGDPASTGKHSYNGQISQIIYDCFGAFEGFVLDTCSGVHEFHCRECGLETVVRRACSEHVRVTVYVREPDPYRPIRIALHCC
ncbi:MAG: hypothetical protein M0P19_14110, partial [Nevskia sp.]|nr:hypothetical protein [Nevskia sp.]